MGDLPDFGHFRKYEEIIPDFDSFLEVLGRPQPYWIRVNTLRIEPSELANRMESKGFCLERFGNLPVFRIVSMPVRHPGATVEHSLGHYYVQDLSSMMPPIALAPQPGETVLDIAAAPGSKTTQMAEMMANTGTIVANDVSRERIAALVGNLERLGVTNVVVTLRDGRSASFGLEFDRVLVDAPCTGEGVVRKNPCGFRAPTERDHRSFAGLQKAILRNAYRHLRRGGLLVYSTCTFNPLENEGVIHFAIENLGAEVLSFSLPIPHAQGVEEWNGRAFHPDVKRCARIYPHMVDTGGMFVGLLRKP